MYEGLGLELIDPLPLVHGAIVADAAHPGGIASRERSWPQAAAMSVPRLRRTVAVTPWARSRSAKARSDGAGGRVPAESVGRVERDEVHVGAAGAGERAEQPPERLGLRRRVVHPGDAGVLERDPAALGARELGGGVEHLGDRVAAVERDERARARSSVAACSDTASVTGSVFGGEPADAGHDADGADGDAPGREPEVVVECGRPRPTSLS